MFFFPVPIGKLPFLFNLPLFIVGQRRVLVYVSLRCTPTEQILVVHLQLVLLEPKRCFWPVGSRGCIVEAKWKIDVKHLTVGMVVADTTYVHLSYRDELGGWFPLWITVMSIS